MLTQKKLLNYAKKGTSIAFSKKSNYLRYKKLLNKQGYQAGYIRSRGPTVDKKGISRAYYAISGKRVKKRQMNTPRNYRRNSNPFATTSVYSNF